MARIRSIKPEFWTSETVARCSKSARLTFIGIWGYVDDNGVGVYNEMLITAALYPLDDPATALIETREDVAELARQGLVQLYQARGKRYIAVSNWSEHQKPSHPRAPRFPRPGDEGCEPLTGTLEPVGRAS
jgi:hypothetical protein